MKNLKRKASVTAAVIAGVVVLVAVIASRCSRDRKTDEQIVSTQLKDGEETKIVLQPTRHRLSLITREGIKYFPLSGDRPLSITGGIDGTYKVTSRNWGTQFRPYVGAGVSDALRVGAGASVFYIRAFDVNLGLTMDVKPPIEFRGLLSLSYNVYNNTYIQVGLETNRMPYLGVFLRF